MIWPVTLLTFTVPEGESRPVQGLTQCCPGWFQPAGSSWQTDPGLPGGNQPLHLVYHGGSRGHLEKPAKNYQGTNVKCTYPCTWDMSGERTKKLALLNSLLRSLRMALRESFCSKEHHSFFRLSNMPYWYFNEILKWTKHLNFITVTVSFILQ